MSTLIVRLPLVLAYFINIPGVLDYLPIARVLMSGLIIGFCSVQISLALHNETLVEALRAHAQFARQNAGRLSWFLVVCGIHFFSIMVCDAIVRSAIADRLGALLLWKFSFAFLRGIVTGWLTANGTCQILHLVLGPLDLNLLGLQVHLNQVVLDITAQSGPGNLLGNLLCSVAHLLDNNGNVLNALVAQLNLILARL